MARRQRALYRWKLGAGMCSSSQLSFYDAAAMACCVPSDMLEELSMRLVRRDGLRTDEFRVIAVGSVGNRSTSL